MTDTYLAAATDLARAMGDLALRYYGAELHVDMKGDGSPVTEADRAAEELAREWIERRFPDDGVLGEEFGTVRPDARRRWIIDPIDGTRSFVRTVPLWGSLVAVLEGDTVLAGAAYFPAVSESISAAPGAGCWWNDRRASVSDRSELGSALVVATDDRFPSHPGRRAAWSALADRAGTARTWGDCFGYLLIATGRAEVMVDDIVSPWDAAAFHPIVTEAGGVFTDWNGTGGPLVGDVIATNAALAGTVRSLLVR